MSVLNVLKSEGFEPVVSAIKNKLPFLAEANLMELEAVHSVTESQYTTEENQLICLAIEECWKQVERLKTEREDLK